MRVAPEIKLSNSDRLELLKISRSRVAEARHVLRARIILLAADGMQNIEIAEKLGIGRLQAARWRGRFLQAGLAGIERDLPRGAPPRKVDTSRIIEITTQTKPELASHWSTRRLAKALGISATTVWRHWRDSGLKPWRVRNFKLSNDPKFAEKLDDIVGLYMNPPDHALVFSCDEKSQIQALERTQHPLPLRSGDPETQTHDYQRHGTTTLFAAMCTLNGKIISICRKRHRHLEWLEFLKKIERSTPKKLELHLIADNYATHKHPVVQDWLSRHPRIKMHFTPTSASWLNMVERFFRDLTTNFLRRTSFSSVPELTCAISRYIRDHNSHPKPFIWTKASNDILQKVMRGKEKLSIVKSKSLH